MSPISRRRFIATGSALTAGIVTPRLWALAPPPAAPPLQEFSYADVSLSSEHQNRQLAETHRRPGGHQRRHTAEAAAGHVRAAGARRGTWRMYLYDPNYDWHNFGAGFAPACTFGQWSPL